MIIVFVFKNASLGEIEKPVFRREIIYPGFSAQFRHQSISGILSEKFAETDCFLSGTVGNCIFVFIAKIVNAVRAGGYAVWEFFFTKLVGAEKAFGDGPFFLGDIKLNIVCKFLVFN